MFTLPQVIKQCLSTKPCVNITFEEYCKFVSVDEISSVVTDIVKFVTGGLFQVDIFEREFAHLREMGAEEFTGTLSVKTGQNSYYSEPELDSAELKLLEVHRRQSQIFASLSEALCKQQGVFVKQHSVRLPYTVQDAIHQEQFNGKMLRKMHRRTRSSSRLTSTLSVNSNL